MCSLLGSSAPQRDHRQTDCKHIHQRWSMRAMMKQPAENARIVWSGMLNPAELVAHPKNWRVHPDHQKTALSGVLDEVGWVQNVIVNRTTGRVLDGHLRVALAISRGEREVPGF